MNKPAVCFKCQVYGRLTEINKQCSHSMPKPKYPSIHKSKIPDDFQKIENRKTVKVKE